MKGEGQKKWEQRISQITRRQEEQFLIVNFEEKDQTTKCTNEKIGRVGGNFEFLILNEGKKVIHEFNRLTRKNTLARSALTYFSFLDVV